MIVHCPTTNTRVLLSAQLTAAQLSSATIVSDQSAHVSAAVSQSNTHKATDGRLSLPVLRRV
jgi:hypothetical protein